MSLVTSHIVPGSREEVWNWHTRPGAVDRLTPPFFPFTPIQATTDLAQGTTIFSLPAGLRWEARHDLSGYVKGFRFTDVCVTAPIRALANWRHSHEFCEVDVDGAPATRITDEVRTRLPKASLAPMFAYRQQQLIHDIQKMAEFAEISNKPLRFAVTGSRGLVGRALVAQLTTLSHSVVRLVREKPEKVNSDPNAILSERFWDSAHPDPQLLADVDVLVHLAGEPIFGRFNDAHKKALRDSRVGPTARLASLVADSARCHVMVSASAIGFYGFDRGDEILTEESSSGSGFLAELTRDWEEDCAPAISAGKRVVVVRTGVVLSTRGGILPVLRTVFSTGLGGRFDDGGAWFSWVSLDDLTDTLIRASLDSRLTGPVNAVSPTPVTNAEMVQALSAQLRRPARFPIPALGPKVLLGAQGAEELVLASQKAMPGRLLELGHKFRYPTIEQALAHELGGERLFDAT
ncbi:putative TIGR01777 family protein [Corynebacterium mustelae]|uniref:Putative TIGR01777 family protein n=1 Tax=Corynebacterium mustelae TaxID=571915 RepID=A0A0G3GXZ9_9CORY|nr:TIGR01777 family oxidoreductase [Corynebacterium mustelae]AKK06034.1 putative TIGR01777 family protein [Corynebacterium mustelae]